jgi:hypothetical protein
MWATEILMEVGTVLSGMVNPMTALAAERLSPPSLRPGSRLAWLTAWQPLHPDPRWLAAMDELEQAVPQLAEVCRSVTALIHAVAGELEPVRACAAGDSVPARFTGLLLYVATDDAAQLRDVLEGPLATAIAVNEWCWTLQWWLAVDHHQVDWEQTKRRWPPQVCGPLGRWVLKRAQARAGAGRGEELQQALQRYTVLPPPWPEDVPPLDWGDDS